jgi:hypothetical protein
LVLVCDLGLARPGERAQSGAYALDVGEQPSLVGA